MKIFSVITTAHSASVCPRRRQVMNRKLILVALVALVWSGLAFCGEIQDAARDGDLAKVRMLLKDQPNLVYSEDATNPTPLLMASAHHHTDVAELLLANKADVNAKTPYASYFRGSTALHLATYYGYKEEAELLLRYHADINATNYNGETPLHLATHYSRKNTVELLLVNKAEVNEKDKNGETPLRDAVEWSSDEVIKLLIAHHADVNAKDNDGRTPLHIALRYMRDGVVKCLLAAGADVNAKDNKGQTPLQFAESLRITNKVELLRTNLTPSSLPRD